MATSGLHLRTMNIGPYRLTAFTALTAAEADAVLMMRNRPEIRRWMYSTRPISPRQHRQFIKHLARDQHHRYWLVQHRHDHQTVGVVYLNRIDRENGFAYLGLYGDSHNFRPGKGNALLTCLITIAFEKLRLHLLLLEMRTDNQPARRLYRRYGFRAMGRISGMIRAHRKRYDVAVLGLYRRGAAGITGSGMKERVSGRYSSRSRGGAGKPGRIISPKKIRDSGL